MKYPTKSQVLLLLDVVVATRNNLAAIQKSKNEYAKQFGKISAGKAYNFMIRDAIGSVRTARNLFQSA